MAKLLASKTTGTSSLYQITIPPEHIRNLGWAAGEQTIVSSDKGNDSIIITRVK